MSEAEEAWRLWHLLQAFADALWERYESAFMDFCGEESGGVFHSRKPDTNDEPF